MKLAERNVLIKDWFRNFEEPSPLRFFKRRFGLLSWSTKQAASLTPHNSLLLTELLLKRSSLIRERSSFPLADCSDKNISVNILMNSAIQKGSINLNLKFSVVLGHTVSDRKVAKLHLLGFHLLEKVEVLFCRRKRNR